MPRKRIVFDATTSPIHTRRQALELGLPRYFTGTPCTHGHLALRYTSTGGCYECLKPKPTWNRRGDEGLAWRPELKVRAPQGVATSFYNALLASVQAHVDEFCKAAAHDLKVTALRRERNRVRDRLGEPQVLRWRDGRPDEPNPDYVTGDARAVLEARLLEIEGEIAKL